MNISNKPFPFIMASSKGRKHPYTNFYRVYDLNKRQVGNLLNTWFPGIDSRDEKGKIFCSELWTVKKVDKASMVHLYNKRYNPISLITMRPVGAKFTNDSNGNVLYNFKATIHSIDDSSYGMWWKGVTLLKIEVLRNSLMRWMELHKEISGEEWFSIGGSLGAVDFDTN